MPTNLPKLTEEDVKQNRVMNRIILAGIALALAGMIWVIVKHYTADPEPEAPAATPSGSAAPE